jgi:hypothetical protein
MQKDTDLRNLEINCFTYDSIISHPDIQAQVDLSAHTASSPQIQRPNFH